MKTGKKICINIPGGNLSPIKFRNILSLANSFGADTIEPGTRQEINFTIRSSFEGNLELETKLNNLNLEYSDDENRKPNIVSSLPVVDIYTENSWVREGVYQDTLSQFPKNPNIKINITDPNQSMFPWWGGDLNFVATNKVGFWNIILKESTGEFKIYPEEIYSNFIGSFVDNISNRPKLELKVFKDFKDFITPENLPNFKRKKFPETEGFHKYGNKYWLGLFSRDYNFPIPLLENLCQISAETQSVKFGITPWRTLIFRDIQEIDLEKWIGVLEKYKYNTRHSGAELAWHISDSDKEALPLKMKILKKLEKLDIFPTGISLGILSEDEEQITSIKIQKKFLFPKWKFLKNGYKIYFSENPWEKSLIPIAKVWNSWDVVKTISDIIEGKFTKKDFKVEIETQLPESFETILKLIYQCLDCGTLYDPEFGDLEQNISLGTNWEAVPESFCCSVCNNPKTGFELVKFQELQT